MCLGGDLETVRGTWDQLQVATWRERETHSNLDNLIDNSNTRRVDDVYAAYMHGDNASQKKRLS